MELDDYDYDGILYIKILQQDMVKSTMYEDVRNRVDNTFRRNKCQLGNGERKSLESFFAFT